MKYFFSQEQSSFPGFSQQYLKFLHGLNANNNREWFAEHRNEYIEYLLEPMKRLVVALTPVMRELDPYVNTIPHRVVSRIYRDVRFSADKTPYRSRLWFAFRREVNCWTETPTYFFQIEESQYLFGMGMYAASSATMRCFREMIDDDPKQFAEIIAPIRKSRQLKLEEERYKRCLPSEHPAAIDAWYQSKTIALLARRKPDKTLFSPKIVTLLTDQFVLLKPLYDFLWQATVLR
ncbi:MAG: DUF2461 domain-containing protein [Planctomycetaceae bacterium]|jgi:uncharacterized protein (TIGR02453 family)|nr:DUF2461 domain-containing protein [Planctomycetaceae bacterium]